MFVDEVRAMMPCRKSKLDYLKDYIIGHAKENQYSCSFFVDNPDEYSEAIEWLRQNGFEVTIFNSNSFNSIHIMW